MSDLATRPEELVCGSSGPGGPETLLLSARRVWLGRTTEVARVLPDRDIRMIGAWCFLDHYGPSDVSASPGMQVWAHPHTGLQTVSWLLDGAVEHRDGLGSHVTVRPRELHLMTAGHGIVHSELSPAAKPPTLHGVQLWVALPGAARDTAPSFSSHRDLPTVRRPGLGLVVLLGTVAGATSPAPTFSPLCGAQLDVAAGTDLELELEPGFEHGVFVIAGDAEVAGVATGRDQLVYLGQGRDRVRLRTEAPARLLLLGGEPFGEEIVMWWNFIGRTHEEVVAYREAWERRDPRFAPVVSRDERVLEAPPDADGAAEASTAAVGPVNPVTALREIGFLLERSRADTHRVKAYRKAADVLDGMAAGEIDDHQRERTWGKVTGIGPKTALVITQALAGEVPEYLQRLRDERSPLVEGGLELRSAIKGDLHCHSTWSDGGSPLEEMMITARDLGHEYCAITDHSPRLTVARGLTAARLREQLAVIDDLNDALDPFRVLKGIEVDILDDGGLDQDDALLAELDVVVASVHSKLRSDSETMTHRMVGAVANPRTNVLGHCTGRLIEGERGLRPQSVFDAEVVFEACRTFDVAVEINSRPERRDPPTDLLRLAIDMGCLFSIDTDAHAPGQLEFVIYGCERAEDLGLDPDRVINTWPLERLLGWCDKQAAHD